MGVSLNCLKQTGHDGKVHTWDYKCHWWLSFLCVSLGPSQPLRVWRILSNHKSSSLQTVTVLWKVAWFTSWDVLRLKADVVCHASFFQFKTSTQMFAHGHLCEHCSSAYLFCLLQLCFCVVAWKHWIFTQAIFPVMGGATRYEGRILYRKFAELLHHNP